MAEELHKYLRPEVLARISDLELRARFVVEGFVSGMHRSPYRGYSVEFAQHKEYSPGDDLRHLDWRVYGRTDRFYIKEYEEETNLRAHLMLDCSSSMRYPEQDLREGRLTKFEYGATVAASLAYLLVHQQDAAGLMLFDDEVRGELAPSSSHAHLKSLIAQIERARLEAPTDARASLKQALGQMHRRSMAVVISDLLDDPEAVISALERIRFANHEVVVLHVLDHDERQFNFMDNTMFEGIEASDQQMLVDPQSLRSGYLDALNRHIAEIRDACTNNRIDYVGLSTTDSLDVALRGYLAARQRVTKTAT